MKYPVAVYSALLTVLAAVAAVVLYVKTDNGLWAVVGAAVAAVAALGGVVVDKRVISLRQLREIDPAIVNRIEG